MSFNMKVTPELLELTEECVRNSSIDPSLYGKYDVKRGLRDINGNGVLAGLTEISDIIAFKNVDGVKTPCDGELYYRGVNIVDLVRGFLSEGRLGFEETAYLLLFGKLPTEAQLGQFNEILKAQQSLPKNFVRDVVMKAPSRDMMNTLSRSVLTLYAYDHAADDTSLPNVLRQCLTLIAVFPMLSVYGFQAYNHYMMGKSLYIHNPSKKLSTAENILRMLRPDKQYTQTEALVLDDISTGASNDIERATKIARAMVTKYGMSEKLGPITYGSDDSNPFLGKEMGHISNYSEQTASEIDEEIQSIISTAYQKTEKILTDHIDELHRLAGVLYEKEKIDGVEFQQVMDGNLLPSGMAAQALGQEPQAALPEDGAQPQEGGSASQQDQD